VSVGRKIFLFHVFVFIFFQVQLLSYPWPIKSFQGPHPVIATLGEFRLPYGSSSYHLHQGIDIKCINGTPVFSIVTGAVEEEGTESIRVGNYRYVHIVPRVNRGDTVEAFVDTIGIIRDF
jgi:murein DD-endopeptidase MepM/ murein hydrolase activator NlpD